jgi:hypothetical protein
VAKGSSNVMKGLKGVRMMMEKGTRKCNKYAKFTTGSSEEAE